MALPNYHTVLLQQINETIGSDPAATGPLQQLLQKISDTYMKDEVEHAKLEAKVALRTDQLVASTSRAYSFLDSVNMGFIMCDISAEVVLSNQAVKHILSQKMTDGSDSEPVQVGEADWSLASIEQLLRPELELKKLILQSLESNQIQEFKEVNYGKRSLHIFIAPMVNDLPTGEKQKIGAVILVEDITEQKVLDRSKDEFLSIASHELRTPLTAIRGNASLIKRYYSDKMPNKDTLEMIDDIHESSVRLIDLVNDFLDVSALEQGKIIMHPEIFSLEEIVTSVLREVHSLADTKSIMLVRDESVASAPPVFADKQRIKQVIYNLVGNAVKFTEKGSISIHTRTDNDYVYTLVSDTGKGMSEESQGLLFRKFQQAGTSLITRDDTKGTGLGLYISKLIIERSGGSISLEKSQPGVGSSFFFTLPRAKTTTQAVAPTNP